MPTSLTPNPEHLDWMRAHGIDPARTVAPIQVTAAPTREHPHRVIVDYETVHGGEGGVQGRTRGQVIANEPPPPGWLLPPRLSVPTADAEQAGLRAEVERHRIAARDFARMGEAAERALAGERAKVARVEALLCEYETIQPKRPTWQSVANNIRAALAGPEPEATE
jgi:hypothetical protein